ncbi:proline dehydrogenase family protein [Spongiactinospora sp. TRM90649]|uniref:proline dehydrogenase family protein n=1 Tax=Spongiactinospora sp. TRM90649 TaxID=3031114 RepID=UPI0023F93E6F|nr:proline dehydrogenase family protein [Spongiactinospora sp. TRM90649]MDF5754912.1 proline dehydrogenase family protein [Spongiactinospora sp. TRM90649]
MLRHVLRALAGSARAESAVASFPPGRALARRHVAGDTARDAVRVARELDDDGFRVSLAHLGDDAPDAASAEEALRGHLDLLDLLADADLADGADLLVRLSELGLRVSERLAAGNAARLCAAAFEAGATVTLDAEEHSLIEPSYAVLDELRAEYPGTGATVQAYLRRSFAQCRSLAGEGSRVRLTRGGFEAPASVAYLGSHEIDKSFVRCLKVLMAARGRPVVATHQRCLIDIAAALAVRDERAPGEVEYQMRYGVRPAEQRRMAGLGATVRVHVPYGPGWFPYLAGRLAQRPAKAAVAARSLVSGS